MTGGQTSLANARGPCVPKLDRGLCSHQSPRPRKTVFIQHGACVVPSAGEVSVTSGPGLANTKLSALVPAPKGTLLPPPHQGSAEMLPPPGSPCWFLQMSRVSDNRATDVAFDQTPRVRLHVCLQKRQLTHALVHSLIHSLTMPTRKRALC